MWQEREPDETRELRLASGHRVVTYRWGRSGPAIFLLNGGPGLPCEYLTVPHLWLLDRGWQVVSYDQLGCGRSDKPDDPSLWRIERYVDEVEDVRNALGLGRMTLLGHSWGGWLAIEYGVTHPEHIARLVLSNTCADMPHLIGELERLRASLGPETVAMMQRHEAEGTLDHPEYAAAITILNYRHVCRLQDWPAAVRRSLDDWNMAVYGAMQGPNEFLYVGNLKAWNRVAELGRITCPTLVTVGLHDELPPACAMRIQHGLPDARLHVFPNSSHMPFYEEPSVYQEVLLAFLADGQ